MTTLVVGASGATGRLLVEQLLSRGQNVRAIVRSPDKLPEILKNHDHLSVIRASILDLSDAEMAQQVKWCDAVASCLGHNMNWKGIYGQPRRPIGQSFAYVRRSRRSDDKVGNSGVGRTRPSDLVTRVLLA